MNSSNKIGKVIIILLAVSLILPGQLFFATPLFAAGDNGGNADTGSGDSNEAPESPSASNKIEVPMNLFRGSGSFSIPIAVMPGTGGISPQLAIVYDSDAGWDSWLGMKFNLAVGGSITRRGQGQGAANFDSSDKFFINVGGISSVLRQIGSSDEYEADTETFNKIIRDTSNNRWRVLGADGTEYQLGYTNNSQIRRVLSDGSIASNTFSNTRAWPISKITNALGYSMEFLYDRDELDQPSDPAYPWNGDYYLKEINYTKHDGSALDTKHKVEFITEYRCPCKPTDPDNGDWSPCEDNKWDNRKRCNAVVEDGSGGSIVQLDKKLTEIRSKAWDKATSSYKTFRSYQLSYENSYTCYSDNPDSLCQGAEDWGFSGKLKLTKVEEYGSQGGLFKRWKFVFDGRPEGWSTDKTETSGETVPFIMGVDNGNELPFTKDRGVRVIDVDGRGVSGSFLQSMKIAGTTNKNVKINVGQGPDKFSDENRTSHQPPLTFTKEGSDGKMEDNGTIMMDLDGNGLVDMVRAVKGACHTTGDHPQVFLKSAEHGFQDDLVDLPIAQRFSHKLPVWTHFINNTLCQDGKPTRQERTGVAALELNGDGCTDLAYSSPDGDGGVYRQVAINPCKANTDWTYINVNGVNAQTWWPDQINIDIDDNALANIKKSIANIPFRFDRGTWSSLDINGDGLSDLLWGLQSYVEDCYREPAEGCPNGKVGNYCSDWCSQGVAYINLGGKGWKRAPLFSNSVYYENLAVLKWNNDTTRGFYDPVDDTWLKNSSANPYKVTRLDTTFRDLNSDRRDDALTNCFLKLNNTTGWYHSCRQEDPNPPPDANPSNCPDCCFVWDQASQTSVPMAGYKRCVPYDLTRNIYETTSQKTMSFYNATALGDWNRNGRSDDFIHHRNWDQEFNGEIIDTDHQKVFLGNGEFPGTLKKVYLPSGATVEFGYQPSSKWKHQDESGQPTMSFVKPVLTSVKTSDGRGNSYETQYEYRGGFYDREDKNFLGFREVTTKKITDPASGKALVSKTYFHQLDALKGSIEKVLTFGEDGNIYAKKEMFYTVDASGNPTCEAPNDDKNPTNLTTTEKPYFNPVTCTRSHTYKHDSLSPDENGPTRYTESRSKIVRDANGYITQQVALNYGEPGVTPASKQTSTITDFVYNDSDNNRLIGLPSTTRVCDGIRFEVFCDNPIVQTIYYYDDNGDGKYSGESAGAVPQSPLVVRTKVMTDMIIPGQPHYPDETWSLTEYDTTYKHPIRTIAPFEAGCVDADGKLADEAKCRISTIAYNAGDHHEANVYPTHATDPLGNTVETKYDEFGRPYKTIDAIGMQAITTYDQFHRPKYAYTQYNGTGPKYSEAWTYYQNMCDDTTNGCSGTDGFPNPNHNDYVKRPRVKTVKKIKDDGSTVYAYAYADGMGRSYLSAVQGKDTDGTAIELIQKTLFDVAGRPWAASLAAKSAVLGATGGYDESELYGEGGTLKKSKWTRSEFDAMGRVIKVYPPQDPAGAVVKVETEYGTWSQKVRPPMLNYTESFTNGLGQLVQVDQEATRQSPATILSLFYDYDVAGNAVATYDGNGFKITANYDGFGRKHKSFDPDLGETLFWYDIAGNLSKQEDAKGDTVSITYDKLGRVLKSISKKKLEDNSYEYYTTYSIYDEMPASGQPASDCVSGIGQSLGKLVRTYNGLSDSVGNPLYKEGTAEPVADNDLYHRDMRIDNCYDNIGRLVKQYTRILDDNNQGKTGVATEFKYEDTGALTQVTYDADQRNGTKEVVTYTTDNLGRMTSVAADLAGEIVTGVSYFPYGQIKQVTLANNVTTNYEYNFEKDQRLARILTSKVGGSCPISEQLIDTYDLHGNITSLRKRHCNDYEYYKYEYDALDRLTKGSIDDVARTYHYDNYGRMTKVEGSYNPFGLGYNGIGRGFGLFPTRR